MPIWAWIVIVAVVVALFVAAWAAWKRRRTHAFGISSDPSTSEP